MRKLIACFCLISPLLIAAQNKAEEPMYGIYQDIEINQIEILDSVVGQYKVFISGENHYFYQNNGNIELKLLAYLNKKAGVKNLLLELGFARGYMLDQYINEDSNYFKLLQPNTGYQYLEFYRMLRNFNQELPSDQRIRVKGIDVERFPEDAPILINKILHQDKKIPENLEFSIEVLRSYAKYCSVKYRGSDQVESDYEFSSPYAYNNYRQFDDEKVLDSMLADYKLKQADFKAYLGTDSTLFSLLMHSLQEFRQYQEYRRMPHQYLYRERVMHANLMRIMKDNPDEKYFGQFGRCHTSLNELNEECRWWAFSSLAKRMNESEYANQILNMAIFYGPMDNTFGYNEFFRQQFDPSDSLYSQLARYLNQPLTSLNRLVEVDDRDSALKSHFKYIIISGRKTVLEKYIGDKHADAVMLNFGVGLSMFNLNRLNDNLFGNKAAFEDQTFTYTFGLTSITDGFYYNLSFNTQNKQSIFFPGLKYTLRSYRFCQSYGYSPHITKRFTAGIYMTYGYSRFSLQIENDSMLNSFSPGFSAIKKVKYINPAFIIGGGLDLRYAFTNWLGIYIRAQYLYDVSYKSWRQKNGAFGVKDKQSPYTSSTHFMANAGISFIFK